MTSWKDKYSHGGQYLVGVDRSHWNDLVDANAFLSDPPDFFIYRTGDGQDVDRSLASSVRLAKLLEEDGIPTGRYHYFRARRSAEAQFALLTNTRAASLANAWGCWVDFEFGAFLSRTGDDRGIPVDVAADRFVELLEMLAANGHAAGVYGNWALRELGGVPKTTLSKILQYPLWVPDYPAPDGKPGAVRATKHGFREPGLPLDWPSWAIHQITSRGEVPGFKGGMDINIARVSDLDGPSPWRRPGPACDEASLLEVVDSLRRILHASKNWIDTVEELLQP